MYDYRQDVINLMKETQDTPASLHQSATALNILLKMYFEKRSEVVTSEKQGKDTADLTNHDENEASDAKPKVKIVKKADAMPKGYSKIRRKLSGALAINSTGQAVAYFNEAICHNYDLNNGDYVKLNIIAPYNPQAEIGKRGKAYIEDHISHLENSDIHEFGPAVVQEKDVAGEKQLIVTRDVNNNSLYDQSGILSFKVTAPYIHAGDSVILAWYDNDPAGTMTVRWKYNDQKDETSLAKPHSYYADKTLNKDDSYTPRLDFDLDGQKVALVCSDDALLKNVNKVVEAHHGISEFVSSNVPSETIAKRLANYPVIILIQSYLHHADSSKIIDTLAGDKHDNKIAMAKSVGQFEIEKALYRAVNKLNIADSNIIDYKIVK